MKVKKVKTESKKESKVESESVRHENETLPAQTLPPGAILPKNWGSRPTWGVVDVDVQLATLENILVLLQILKRSWFAPLG